MSDEGNGEKRVIPQLSVDTQILYERIKKAAIGDFISYPELTALIDRNVQTKGYSALMTARKMARRNDRMVFECVRGEGLKRLDDHGIVTGIPQQGLKRIRHISRTAAMKLSCVQNFDGLQNGDKISHNAAVSLFGAITLFTRERSVKRIEAAVQEKADKLPVMKTLELFKS